MELIQYFTDPVLRAPTIGSMLMCLASSLVGILVFIRKRSLLGEALSHASYPGVVISIILLSSLFPYSDEILSIGVLAGAFISALLGLWTIEWMEKKLKIKNDAALCFVLSLFFGIGVLIASRIQVTHTLWYKQIQLFLFGQAATMTDSHIIMYFVLSLIIASSIALLYRPIQIINFDRDFAKTIGIRISLIEGFLFALLVLAIVIGIRSVGVVLMSSMLIAPAVAARQLTNALRSLFFLAGFLGMVSGFLGNYFSLELSLWATARFGMKFSLPTGPMIVLVAAFICILSLLLAPRNGLLARFFRALKFKQRCQQENLLKTMWKGGEEAFFSVKQLAKMQNLSMSFTSWLVKNMKRKGWVALSSQKRYSLTGEGHKKAAHIIRLHRLWEAYLVYMGQGVEKVHRNAEEMEHILTPEMEQELTVLLHNPKRDPHHQIIPEEIP